ncbi:MAG: DNA replication and repair protein RecF, partial [Halocynthiibacter sp.]
DSLRSAFHDNRRQDMFAGRTLIGPHRSDLLASYADKDMAAKECSTGEQKALLVSLILANARALQAQVGMAPILLLDEVAAHLDPDRRKALYDEIDALGAQAFMTGTEAGLFEAIQSRAMSIEVFGDAGGSEAKAVI